jgi:serine/threonine-protein kinase
MFSPPPDADHTLLFGLLALEGGFTTPDALAAGLGRWVRDRTRPLGLLLLEEGALRADALLMLETLVGQQLQTHGGDPRACLGAVVLAEDLRARLQGIPDADLQAALASTAMPGTLLGAPPAPPASPAPAAPPEGLPGTLIGSSEKPATVEGDLPGTLLGGSANAAGLCGGRAGAGPSPGNAASRYRVLRSHARGGLGEVFVAHDEELGREVALKEIQSRHADHPESRARFLLEGEITGSLEHPGIVPVYGLGSYPDGRPYYAMRFIRGESLQQAIGRFHKAEKAPHDLGQRAVEFRRLLGRFVAVCNAVAYAHSRGVLHRDIKPANVMLGAYGETLVVDWGLAKPLGRSEPGAGREEKPLAPAVSGSGTPTLMGQTIGTPQYMSPEQADGRLDDLGPASDVYSLGATLYCLLTGQPPFTSNDVWTVLRQVRQGEYPRPRQLRPQVSPALQAVCLKAMALRPADRYPTAQALAEDLEHWLADEPVSAYRDPFLARAARWARRHRTATAVCALLLVTTTGGLTLTTVLVSREQQRTAEQRRLAEQNFQTALRAVDTMLTEVAQEQLVPEPRMEKKRRALLAKARTYYEEFLGQRGGDPGLRREAALAHKRLGDITRLLGDHTQARESYGRAIEMLTELAAADRGAREVRFALGVSCDDLGEVWRRTSHPAEAAHAYRRAIDIQEQLLGEDPDRPEYSQELARSHDNLGIVLRNSGKRSEAEESLDRAIGLFRKLAADHPKTPAYRQHLARAYLNLGSVFQDARRPEKGEKAYRHAIRLQTQLVANDPLTPDYRYELGVSHRNLGYLFETTGRYAQAREELRKAVDRFTRLSLDFPDVPVYQAELAGTENILAIVFARQRRWSAAEGAWGKALSLLEKLAADHPDAPDYLGHQGMALENLGWLLLQQKDLPWASGASLVLGSSAPGGAPFPAVPAVLVAQARRAELLARACRRLETAMRLTDAALKPNPDNPSFLQARRDQLEYLARAHAARGEHAEAARLAGRVPEVFRTRGEDYFVAAGLLAECVTLVENDPASARRYADQAVALLRQGVALGCKDAGRLGRPPFTVLRQRPDFQKLIAGLNAADGGR